MFVDPSASYVNTTQVAKALGLSVSTIKRWVDEGVLPALKTAGGHRKMLLADVMELARRGDLPHADLSFLLEASEDQQGKLSVTQIADDLYRSLRSGDGVQIRGLILGAFRSGVAIEDLADRIIRPAMTRIGHDWHLGRIDVMEEHRATQFAAAALYELKALLEDRADKNQPSAVGGAITEDYSVLPSLLAQMVLIDAGWEAINLGQNTPFQTFVKAMQNLRPRLLWISVCHLKDEPTFLKEYPEVYRQAEKLGVAVAIGGRALTEEIRTQIPYTTYGDGLAQLAAFARTLHPPPRRPTRGRPRST